VSLGARRAELRGAGQRLDASDGIAAGKDPRCRRFELGRNRLVRLERRLREMPRPAFELVRPDAGQHTVGASTFLGLRQGDDGRSHERVAERKPVCALVHVRESCLLRRRKIAKAGVRHCSPLQDADVSSAVERHAQEDLTRPRRKLGDPRFEERLEPSTER
jgi:hypothetical protein